MEKTVKNDAFFEKVRGLAIIAVLLAHTVPVDSDVMLSVRQFWVFPSLLFIFLAGYFVKKQRVVDNLAGFVRKRLVRIIQPYFFWSFAALLLKQVSKILQHTDLISLKDMVFYLVTGQALYPYYFLVVLAQLIVLTPVMVKLDGYPWGRMLMYSLTPVSVAVMYCVLLQFGDPGFPYTDLPFFSWVFFYYWGYRAGNCKTVYEKMISGKSVFLLTGWLVLVAASALESQILEGCLGLPGFAAGHFKVTSLLTAVALTALLFSIKEKTEGKMDFLSVPGRNSFGIYLVHAIITISVKRLLPSGPAVPVFCFAAGLFGSLAVIYCGRKVCGDSFARKYLGF